MPDPTFVAVAASINQRLGAIEAAQTAAGATVNAAMITAVVAAVAAALSFCGVVFNAFVLRRNGFVQTRATQQLKHAEFRQAWINALREEMARFHLLTAQSNEHPGKEPEVIQSMAMILMRMNRRDMHYDELVENMDRMIESTGERLRSGKPVAHPDAAADFLLTCQKILKREWETTRTGMLEKPPKWRTAEELAGERSDNEEEHISRVPRHLKLRPRPTRSFFRGKAS